MKVITEESLRYVIKMHFGSNDVNKSLCSHLINELQEIDTLTVSTLRPMVERSDRPYVLVDNDFSRYLIEAEVDYDKKIIITRHGQEIDFADCNGWIPVPIYRPKDGA